jgi:hypothetical protein
MMKGTSGAHEVLDVEDASASARGNEWGSLSDTLVMRGLLDSGGPNSSHV